MRFKQSELGWADAINADCTNALYPLLPPKTEAGGRTGREMKTRPWNHHHNAKVMQLFGELNHFQEIAIILF